jgi:hypothetical protein
VPTVVAALTLVGLLRLSFVGVRPWELAFLYALIVGLALWPALSWWHWFLNVAALFTMAWTWFALLGATDNIERRPLHWLVLFFGFLLMVGSRAYVDLIVYQTF